MPIISEISDDQLAGFSRAARENGTLRTFVESITALDPLLADFLYIVDHSADGSRLPIATSTLDGSKLIRLSSWQSYGRPEVIAFEAAVDQVYKSKPVAVVLPCSRKRPYGASRTHKKIWQALKKVGYEPAAVDQIVITSLGVVPEQLWEHPVAMGYDGGVPDIYRVLRLSRRFFGRNIYTQVIDCLQFAPYSDIFRILRREKILKRLFRGPVLQSRQFYLKP
jgi:predicted RNA-binding protein